MIGVITSDPTQKNVLAPLAVAAQTSLSGDMQQAAAGVAALQQALSGGSANTAAPAAPAAPNGAAPPSPPATTSAPPADSGRPTAAPAAAATNGATPPMSPPATSAAPPNGAAPTAPTPPNGAATGAPASSPAIAQGPHRLGRDAWKKVEGDLGKLHSAFANAFKGHEQEEQIGKAFQARVETVLNTLDEGLAHTLDAVNNAKDPSQRTQLVQQAQQMLQKYQQHVASDPTIAALDNNPFVPLSVQKTMTATIAALARSIR